jgi:cysteine desulfurase
MQRAIGLLGNPSSVHAAGREARELLDRSRAQVARAISAAPAEIVFTSGATESAALAIRGLVEAAPSDRRELVVTCVEHPCVLSLAQALARTGVSSTLVPVDRRGCLDLEALRRAVSDRTALVCAMLANNETGVLFPMRELAAIARNAGALLFCDAAQAVGKIDVEAPTLGADLLALTGPKLGGPRGVGALYVRSGIRLAPLSGGHQERGRRGGTENLWGAAGLASAVESAVAQRTAEQARIRTLRDRLERGLIEAVPDARVNGAEAERLSGTASITFFRCDGEALLMALDLSGLCASAGSACTSGSTRPSHVLSAMGLSPDEARATLRFSLGWTTTQDEIDAALEIIPPLVARVRRAIPMGGPTLP